MEIPKYNASYLLKKEKVLDELCFIAMAAEDWFGNMYIHIHVTQYSSTAYVYRDCLGWSSIISIHKDIFGFHFSLTSNDIKVENMSKSNCMAKIL